MIEEARPFIKRLSASVLDSLKVRHHVYRTEETMLRDLQVFRSTWQCRDLPLDEAFIQVFGTLPSRKMLVVEEERRR